MNASERPRFAVRLRSGRVQKELDSLTGPDHRRVLEVLRSLAEMPRPPGCQKVYDNVFRVRVGQWRVIYLVDGDNQKDRGRRNKAQE